MSKRVNKLFERRRGSFLQGGEELIVIPEGGNAHTYRRDWEEEVVTFLRASFHESGHRPRSPGKIDDGRGKESILQIIERRG